MKSTTLDTSQESSASLPCICLITETYFPVIGGGETQSRALAQDLVSNGYQVILVTRRSKQEFKPYEELDGAKVYRLWPVGNGQMKKWLMLLSSFLFYVRHRREYDVILVSGYRVLGISAVLASLLLGKKCILKADNNGEMSGDYFTLGLKSLKLSWAKPIVNAILALRNRLFRLADVFIALSSEIVAELTSHGVKRDKIVVIPNSYDSRRFIPDDGSRRTALRSQFGFPLDHKIVIFTGRLLRAKGLPLLLQVWKTLQPNYPQVSLVIVGSGGDLMSSCEDEIKEYVRSNNLSASVFFTGGVRNVEQYLHCADIFVFPTEDEAFGISLIEAMACGLPPIATKIGGIKDIIQPEETGILISAADFDALRNALQRFLADPQFAQRIGEQAAVSVRQRYTREIVADGYMNLFNSLSQAKHRWIAKSKSST